MSAQIQYPFAVSAPGKVIVFGEHAVVHGQPAIAAALSLRSYLLVSLEPSNGTITLDFPDIKLHHEWRIESLPWHIFRKKRAPSHQRVLSLDPELAEALAPSLQSVAAEASAETKRIHRAAVSAFLYTLLSLADSDFPSCTYTLRSTIPIASGLGSSASISVCISMAVLVQSGHVSQGDFSHEARNLVNNWAFVGELNLHGNPSGIDNTVATLGKAVLFQRNPPPQLPSITPLTNFPTLSLLLVDTKQPRSTAVEVGKVQKLKDTHPSVANPILDAIGNITSSVHSLINSIDFDSTHPDAMAELGQLIRLNHGLLATLGVSHPRLERVRELVDQQGLGWSKLTGGGGGGCHFAVLNPAAPHNRLGLVEKSLKDEGYARYETLLGGRGAGYIGLAEGEAQAIGDMMRSTQDASDVEAHIGVTAGPRAALWKFFD